MTKKNTTERERLDEMERLGIDEHDETTFDQCEECGKVTPETKAQLAANASEIVCSDCRKA